MNNYHLYEEIGHGKFSVVYKGRKRHTIRYLAVKSVEKGRRDKVVNEVSVLSRLNHPNVVGLVSSHETRNHLWVISDFCAGGDLLHLLKQDGRLPEAQVRPFAHDLAAGLLHVQARGVVYCDMKPANVLISEDGALRLSNFGHAQPLDDLARLLREGAALPRRGTPHYMAPELFHERGVHSFASDLWALGCVVHEMLTGRPPFHATSIPEIQDLILHAPLPMAADGSPDLQALLASLLQKAPLDRASWRSLRAHPLWEGRPPGDDADAAGLPEQPQLPHLRTLWEGLAPGAARALDGAAARAAPGALQSAAAEAPPAGRAPGSPAAWAPPAFPPRAAAPAGGPPPPAPGASAWPQAGPHPTPRRHGGCGDEEAAARAREARGAPAAGAAGPTAAAAAAAAAPRPPPPAGGGGAPATLAARLGASALARARELVCVADAVGCKPISRNPQIEEPELLEVPAGLPFESLSSEEICACAQQHVDLEAFFAQLCRCLSQGPLEQRLGTVRYLEHVCAHMHVADLVVNSQLLRLVLHTLQPSGTAGPPAPLALRAGLLALLGQLLRHATYLQPAAAEAGLLDALRDALGDREGVVRRRAAAALGELLFYIATQPATEEAEADAAGGAANDWQVPRVALSSFVLALTSPDGDEVVQHYAAKTIENVATQAPAVAQEWFFSPELIQALTRHACHAASDPFRLSCLSAAARLVRDCAEDVDAAALVDPALVRAGLGELAPHGVPHSLQLVAAVLLRAPGPERAEAALPQDAAELLLAATSQPRHGAGLRARAALLLALLLALEDPQEPRRLIAALDGALVPSVDRLCRERGHFVAQCVAATAVVMEAVAAGALQGLVEGLRRPPWSPGAAAADLAGSPKRLLPALLHLAASSMLCGCVLGARALPLLGTACELASQLPPAPRGPGELQPLLLMVVEALSAQQALVLECALQVVRCILPPLASFLKSDQGDVRLLALKCFSGLCLTLVNDAHAFSPEADRPSEAARLLQTLLCRSFLPMVPALLADDPPGPDYAMRLVAALLGSGDRAAAAARTALRELGLARPLLLALGGRQGLTLHAAVLAHCLLRGREVEARDLLDAGVFDAVREVLAEAAEAAGESLAHVDFAMVDVALTIAEEALRQAAEPDARGRLPAAALADVGPLAGAMPVLAALCAPLAGAGLAALLDRATSCCERLAGAGAGGGNSPSAGAGAGLSIDGAASLVEALGTAAQWKQVAGLDPAASRRLQRRLLALLAWAATADAGGRVRAEVAAGVDRLLQARALADDAAVAADARGLVAATLGRGAVA